MAPSIVPVVLTLAGLATASPFPAWVEPSTAPLSASTTHMDGHRLVECAAASAGVLVAQDAALCISAGFPAWHPSQQPSGFILALGSVDTSAVAPHSLIVDNVPTHPVTADSPDASLLLASLGWAVAKAGQLAATRPPAATCTPLGALGDHPLSVVACTAPTALSAAAGVGEACGSDTCLAVVHLWLDDAGQDTAAALRASPRNDVVLVLAPDAAPKYWAAVVNGGRVATAGFPRSLTTNDTAGNTTSPWTGVEIDEYQVYVWVWVLLVVLIGGAFWAAVAALGGERDALLHSAFQASDFHAHND